MQNKLVQAAIITFLLHLIAGISPNARLQTRTVSPTPTTASPIISLLLRSWQ